MDRRGMHGVRGAIMLAACAGISAALPGCATPWGEGPDEELRRSIAQSVRRELDQAPKRGEVETSRQNRVEALELKPETRRELEGMSGVGSYASGPPPYGPTLQGDSQATVAISLGRAVSTSAQRNLAVQFARLGPGISEAQAIAAQAAFDWTLFSNLDWNRLDQARPEQQFGLGQSNGVNSNEEQSVDTRVGVRKRMETGGTLTIQQGYKYTDEQTRGLSNNPNPANEATLTLQLDQPLLRNAGEDAALASVRLTRNAERDQIHSLKAELLKNVTDTEQAYWQLVQSYNDLQILDRLLQRGEEVKSVLKSRLAFDAKQSQYSDAVATVETRRSDVIRAQNALRQASDRLKVLMNDPEMTIASDVMLIPSDQGIDAPIRFDPLDAIRVALRNRPEISRALLSIDDTSIRQQLADNARLPLLDLQAQTRFNSLDGSGAQAFDKMTAGKLVDFLVSLKFEQPLGNREAEANFRARRLQRMQSVTAYRNTVQGIVSEVITALRDVDTNFKLIEQTRAQRLAAAENLRSLVVEEENLRAKTPEFLDLKFRRQQALAAAEQAEVAALANYNISVARYYAAVGTALDRNRIQFDVADAPALPPSLRKASEDVLGPGPAPVGGAGAAPVASEGSGSR
ncbi:MAG: TolC family protein [Phycisphaerae bacterium]|nr:TolC family protein [Phycisphaerae bacterium]